MPSLIHIEGGSTERLDHFEVKPDETIGQVAERLGLSIREENVEPAAPRTLGPEAADLLRSYEYEDPDSVLAIYWRRHSLDAEEFETAEEAERFIEGGEEYGSLAGEAIVVGDQIIVLD